jgi:hypothetical protein
LSGHQLEMNADVTIVEVVDIFRDRVGEIGKGFDVINEFFVARAINLLQASI